MANRDLVVIGGSAGALPALRTILASLPVDLPAAVAVVIHVQEGSMGVLAAVAAANSSLPVKHAERDEPVLSGNVYVAPPNHHLLVHDARLVFGDGPRENLSRPAIDPLFRSAALDFGPRTVGVILSGSLDDGASGLASIKDAGGVAAVQSPRDARVSEMPLAALKATPVDISATAEDLGPAIERLVRQPPGKQGSRPESLAFEVAIAMGSRIDPDLMKTYVAPDVITCPDCGGVLGKAAAPGPLRFRCRVGHAYTGSVLMKKQEGDVDEAVRVALRIIEERAELVARMGEEAAEIGRPGMAELYERRALEYRRQAETLRRAVLRGLTEAEDEGSADEAGIEVHGSQQESEL